MKSLLVVISCCLAFSSSAGAVKPGDRAREFRLKNLAGEVVTLSSFRGKVVLLDFWASWCKGCKKEMPALDALVRARKNDVVFLGVSVDRDADDAKKFLRPLGLTTLIVALDPDAAVLDSYEIVRMPALLVIDRQGVVRFVHSGAERALAKKVAAEIDALRKG